MSKMPFKLPPLNHYPSRKEWGAFWKKILNSGKFLDSLVTPYERRNIVMRAATKEYLVSGKKFQQIVRELQLSPQTVSSIKKTLKENYKSYWERSKTERKKKVWSPFPSQKKKEPYRPYRRTKYGKVYLPY